MDAVSHGHRPLMKGQWCRASSTKQDQTSSPRWDVTTLDSSFFH